MGQPLDLGERLAQLRVAQDGALELVHLVQVFGSDGFLQDALGQHAQPTQHDQHRHPAGRGQEMHRGHDHDGPDQGEQIGDDLPSEDQDLLGPFKLVAQHEGEVEQAAGGEKVGRHQGERGRQEIEGELADPADSEGQGVVPIGRHERDDLAAGVDPAGAPGAAHPSHVRQYDPAGKGRHDGGRSGRDGTD